MKKTPKEAKNDIPLKALKKGDKGPKVLELQNKLIERGWLKASINGAKQADGIFWTNTDKAVRAFQLANDLVVDGRVGPITWKALFLGTLPVEPAPVEGEVQYPELPRSRADIKRIFGENVVGGSNAWESRNLAFCEVPLALKAFPFRGNTGKRGFTCHRLLVSVFQSFFNEIVAQGLADKVETFDGCYNPRKITGGSDLSFHAYAIAIDFNAEDNAYGDSTPAMDRRIVEIGRKHRLRWGGNYSGKKDGMHFEYFEG